MFFGEADINKCYQIMAQLMFAFGIGTKITISLGTISRRSNIICSSPREYCNKKTQTDMFDPKYTLTRSTVKMLTSIAESKVAIERAKILPQQEIELRYQALMRMAHSSTAIEGNQLDINEVMALWADKEVCAFQTEINEVKNYFKALRYIEKIGSRKQPITKKVLLHIHELVTDKILTKEQCGKYRKCPISVMKKKPGFPDQIIYTGPEARKVPDLCKNLLAWIDKSEKEDINPVIVAAIVHQEIAAIHPFIDGNGRTARVLATLILYRSSYNFRRFFALEDYYYENLQAYYKAINMGESYERRKNFTPWIEYFVRGFKEEIDRIRINLIMP